MHCLLLARSVSTFLLVVLPEALARYQGINDEMKVFRIISCKRVGAKSRIQRRTPRVRGMVIQWS
jgi:hypothetical protein